MQRMIIGRGIIRMTTPPQGLPARVGMEEGGRGKLRVLDCETNRRFLSVVCAFCFW